MSNAARRVIAAAVAAMGLGIGSAVWAASSASAVTAAPAAPAAPAAIPPVCTSANLAVWVNVGAGSGAAGTIYYPLEFTNVSNHTCRLWGYPGVSAVGANGKQLGSAAGRNSVYPGAWVNIPAGGTAHALLGYGDVEVSTSGCHPANAATIKVYPPSSFSADSGFFDLPSCTVAGHVYLTVSVIRPGANI